MSIAALLGLLISAWLTGPARPAPHQPADYRCGGQLLLENLSQVHFGRSQVSRLVHETSLLEIGGAKISSVDLTVF